MTKKQIIKVLENKREYYYNLASHYFDLYLHSKHKPNKEEYYKLNDYFYNISCIIEGLLQQVKQK